MCLWNGTQEIPKHFQHTDNVYVGTQMFLSQGCENCAEWCLGWRGPRANREYMVTLQILPTAQSKECVQALRH